MPDLQLSVMSGNIKIEHRYTYYILQNKNMCLNRSELKVTGIITAYISRIFKCYSSVPLWTTENNNKNANDVKHEMKIE